MAKITLTDISAGYALITTINANNALIEAAIENTMSRDGTTPNTMSGALDMNSQALNNLVDAVSAQQPVTLAQLTAAQSATISAAAASIVTITDTAGDFVATTVEGALAEIWTLLLSTANGAGAAFVGIEDAATVFTAINVEAALAEIFTGAFTYAGIQTFTAQPIFKAATGIQIQDSGGTDTITLRHDGTDAKLVFTNTTDLDIDGITSIDLNAILTIEGNNALVLQGASAGVGTAFTRAGIAEFSITSTSASDVWKFRDGPHIRIYDDGDTDYVQLDHDGTDFNITGTNTVAINIDTAIELTNYFVPKLTTTAALAASANAINTSANKIQGAMVYNTDTDNPVYAAGPADADIWVDGSGATAHSPS